MAQPPARPAVRKPRFQKSRPPWASCRNGIWPIFIPGSTIPPSSATSIASTPNAGAFEEAYKGKLAELAQSPEAGSALAEAVRRL